MGIGQLYEMLWSRVGGRPWTSISRAAARAHPLTWTVGGYLAGLVMGRLLQWPQALWVLLGLFSGIILGHLFWDTRGAYIPGKGRGTRNKGHGRKGAG